MLEPAFFREILVPHESRLTLELRALLHSQRVAALATVNEDASPFVSMVPFAIELLLACLVLHGQRPGGSHRQLAG